MDKELVARLREVLNSGTYENASYPVPIGITLSSYLLGEDEEGWDEADIEYDNACGE